MPLRPRGPGQHPPPAATPAPDQPRATRDDPPLGRTEEDRLDAVENALVSPAKRRGRDVLFFLGLLILTGIVLVILFFLVRRHW
jgi:hypothetical protein